MDLLRNNGKKLCVIPPCSLPAFLSDLYCCAVKKKYVWWLKTSKKVKSNSTEQVIYIFFYITVKYKRKMPEYSHLRLNMWHFSEKDLLKWIKRNMQDVCTFLLVLAGRYLILKGGENKVKTRLLNNMLKPSHLNVLNLGPLRERWLHFSW